ncbi:hypothetical protein CRUP_006980 [Coryphaenoides rupestris]|nr:hypothetical protein CRUP_006980 [Coryphaenoides rupestris]
MGRKVMVSIMTTASEGPIGEPPRTAVMDTWPPSGGAPGSRHHAQRHRGRSEGGRGQGKSRILTSISGVGARPLLGT